MNDQIDKILYDALEEDIPTIDITTDNLFTDESCEAVLIAKENGVISGVKILQRLYQILDDDIYIKVINHDSTYVEEGDIIAIISGNLRTVIKGRRIALNFIQRMSAIASKTKKCVDLLDHSYTKITDSRNTTPTFRYVERLAVVDGGAINHRGDLSSQVLLEKTHSRAYGSIKNAISHIVPKIDHSIKVEIEVNTFEEFLEAIHTECDIIMLRNMSDEIIRKCVNHNTEKLLEVNVAKISQVKPIANTGIDFISVDELTHSYTLMNIELNIN